MARPIRIDVRLTTDADKDLPTFDNTKLSAINQCPTWGLIRYEQHKTMPGAGRAMALEAGKAMHDVFAAVRLWQLGFLQGQKMLMIHHGARLFGRARWGKMSGWLVDTSTLPYGMVDKDDDTARLNFVLEALYTSGFYDDPNDNRRTMRNMEECAIAYLNKYQWDKWPVWVRDPHDPESDVGIEVPIDIVITFTYDDPILISTGAGFGVTTIGGEKSLSIRFTGRMDGVHTDGEEIVVQENKTASRLNDAWFQSFELSHQITGYMLAMKLWTGKEVSKAVVRGITIPLPKSYDFGGVATHVVRRDSDAFAHWFNWLHHTVSEIWLPNKDNVINAPRYTHSCNRYFRPCSLIPFCAVPDEDKQAVLDDMEYKPWSPLAEEHETGD